MTIGRAYGIFKSRYAYGGIISKLADKRPAWRHQALQGMHESLSKRGIRYGIYSTTEVGEGTDIVKEGGQPLAAIAREWEGRGANYLLKLSMQDSTNGHAADELQSLFGALCSEPGAVPSSAPFLEKMGNARATIYFRGEGDDYTFRLMG